MVDQTIVLAALSLGVTILFGLYGISWNNRRAERADIQGELERMREDTAERFAEVKEQRDKLWEELRQQQRASYAQHIEMLRRLEQTPTRADLANAVNTIKTDLEKMFSLARTR